VAQDLYLVLAPTTLGLRQRRSRFCVNPLINWVWFGVGIMVIGTIIALLPERALAFAASRGDARTVTTATTASVLLLALALNPAVAFAQETGLSSVRPWSAQNEIMCTCGCRLPAGTCGMPNCHGKAEQLEKPALVAEGKSRDEILATFVRDFGSEDILARPRDRGFGRLAWLLPYGAAAGIGSPG
jgi:cytochrome c-type biogenesis protein CcmF